MKLKSFGCSFTWGSDLKDESSSPAQLPSRLTWPALLAKHYNLDYSCCAWPGIGNLAIADTLLTEISKNSNDVFIINWTYIDRYDYIPADLNLETFDRVKEETQLTSTPAYELSWRTIRPAQDNKRSLFYYKEIHSEYADKLLNLNIINNCLSLLREKDCKFIMTSIDPLLLDSSWNTRPGVLMLQTRLRHHLTYFNNLNFIDFSALAGVKFSKSGHVLEEGHRRAADYIINNVSNEIFKS